MPRRLHVFVLTLCTAVIGAYLWFALYFPELYIWMTYEDLTGEWLQFWMFLFAMVFFTQLSFSPSPYRIFFIALALGCFYVSMEEISWGQRVLNLSTPDFFQKHNIQNEINLHNLFTGPVSSLTKKLITYGLSLGLAVYGIVYPLAVRWGWHLVRPLLKLGIAPPPLFLWPFFVFGSFLELGLFRFNETEVAETLVSTALAMMGLYFVRLRKVDRKLSSLTARRNIEIATILPLCLLLTIAGLLAVGTTVFSYASEHNRSRIDNRLENGIEKFAGRYKRYGNWEMAAELYRHLHRQEPKRSSILRKLADCYRQMGSEDKFAFYNGKALANDLARYEENPNSIALNQSLARTYRQRHQPAKADVYLQHALRLSKKSVEEKPRSAKAAYWLGKTYQLLGQDEQAAQHFSRAHDLNPASLKYRKVHHRASKY